MRAIVAFVLAASVSPAFAQTIYKCKAEDGTPVYSQRPCATNEREVQQLEVKAQKPSTVDEEFVENMAAMRRNVEEADIGHAETLCVRAANERVFTPMNRRVAEHQAKIKVLYHNMSYASNNMAGAVYMNGLREQISQLEQSITDERTAADRLHADELRRCSEDRARREREFREKHQQ